MKNRIHAIRLKIEGNLRGRVQKVNHHFNSLPLKVKRVMLLVFGLVMGGVSLMLIIQALSNKENNEAISIQRIKMPKDIYMKEEQAISEDQLIPVGKFKGEINDEFEAFYLAVDTNGKTYINRSLDFSRDAYDKSNGWEEISKAELEHYQKQLHFVLPAKNKGLKP